MEQAVYIHCSDQLRYLSDDFTRLYFGAEFCERLIPPRLELQTALRSARERSLGFTFMTPFVTNRGLEQLEELLAVLEQSLPDAEVVVNDWGVLQLLRSEHPRLRPVLGRLLNKSKRGPRLMNIFEQLPAETKSYFQGSNLDVPAAVRFLAQQGISRVEFDNLLQGLNLEGTDAGLHKSLYVPFAFISATRFCLSANCDDPVKMGSIGIFPCGRECLKYSFNLYNPVMTLPLIRRGNAVFFIHETIPDAVTRHQVDRIVVQPELPV
ncbi:MAG: hypothetical protein JW832_13310 [Deltaproteobacteria bacterium]|nr:hypothetical protein [Deltaproteobacteria bacterium]